MKSALLEQAIVDAKAIKDLALKNAESVVMEKYSVQIKEAVDKLLEQDEEEEDPMAGMPDDLDVGMEMGGDTSEKSNVSDDVPLAATDGEKLCPCKDNEEEVEIDFDDLEREMMSSDEIEHGEMTDTLDFSDELSQEFPEEFADEDELAEGLQEEEKEETLEEEMDEELEVDSDEDFESLKERIREELEVELKPSSNGWLGTNNQEKMEANDFAMAAAVQNADEMEEDPEKAEDENYDVQQLRKQLDEMNESFSRIKEENKKMKSLLIMSKQKLQELNLVKARLHYVNQTLKIGNSLNERQKKTIVENVNKASSVVKIEAIFDAVQSVMGTSQNKSKMPKSLREAVERTSTSTILLKSGGNKLDSGESIQEQSFKERMQVLAGIRK